MINVALNHGTLQHPVKGVPHGFSCIHAAGFPKVPVSSPVVQCAPVLEVAGFANVLAKAWFHQPDQRGSCNHWMARNI